jgi:hypothetical protein
LPRVVVPGTGLCHPTSRTVSANVLTPEDPGLRISTRNARLHERILMKLWFDSIWIYTGSYLEQEPASNLKEQELWTV